MNDSPLPESRLVNNIQWHQPRPKVNTIIRFQKMETDKSLKASASVIYRCGDLKMFRKSFAALDPRKKGRREGMGCRV
jgi:hypothetical protein